MNSYRNLNVNATQVLSCTLGSHGPWTSPGPHRVDFPAHPEQLSIVRRLQGRHFHERAQQPAHPGGTPSLCRSLLTCIWNNLPRAVRTTSISSCRATREKFDRPSKSRNKSIKELFSGIYPDQRCGISSARRHIL